MEENTFDMLAHFESLPSTDEKTPHRAALYGMQTILERNWESPLAQELFPLIEQAIQALRDLPTN